MKTIAVVLLAAGFLTACDQPMPASTGSPASTGPEGPTSNSYTVNIFWKDGSECEVDKVEEPVTTCTQGDSAFCVGRNDFITWQGNSPSNAKYEIFFDPIRGMPLKAGNDGSIKRPIDENAPLANYKYSIVRDGCPPNADNTFDPHIRVDH